MKNYLEWMAHALNFLWKQKGRLQKDPTKKPPAVICPIFLTRKQQMITSNYERTSLRTAVPSSPHPPWARISTNAYRLTEGKSTASWKRFKVMFKASVSSCCGVKAPSCETLQNERPSDFYEKTREGAIASKLPHFLQTWSCRMTAQSACWKFEEL